MFGLLGLNVSATARLISRRWWWRWNVSLTGGGNRSTRRVLGWHAQGQHGGCLYGDQGTNAIETRALLDRKTSPYPYGRSEQCKQRVRPCETGSGVGLGGFLLMVWVHGVPLSPCLVNTPLNSVGGWGGCLYVASIYDWRNVHAWILYVVAFLPWKNRHV